MGYGHSRAAEPLKDLAYKGSIITANNYEGIPDTDRKIWKKSEASYYFVSRLRDRGWWGKLAFNFFDRVQGIRSFYPRRDEFKPSLQLKQMYAIIKGGWGRDLIERLAKVPIPLITTFFTAAHMAEHWRYPGPIYVILTDADISRAWAPLAPPVSNVFYLAPTSRAALRLERFYGVHQEKIFVTGFPLPKELIGPRETIVRSDTLRRIDVLDPKGVFRKSHGPLIKKYLGAAVPQHRHERPVSVTYVVGGAGAQAAIGTSALRSLAPLIREKKVRLNLVAGIHGDIAEAFHKEVHSVMRVLRCDEEMVKILQARTKERYFALFNETLRETDVLWTKPSELSFYAGLGIPIIIAPPLGAQERKNRGWLVTMGAGLDEFDSRYAHEWLPDLVLSGRLAEAALQGFIKIRRNAVERIGEIISSAGQKT